MSITLYSNDSTKALIKSFIKKGREPHSIAIFGEKGQGKKTMASYIAAALLCESGEGEPCGKCKSCRMIAQNAHPDFITAQANENGNYTLESIRSIVSDAVIKPNESKYKIYLIPDLDKSGNTLIQVQNTLLKLIEEPPAHCIIILTAVSRELFLPTILSRVISLNVCPCTSEQSREYLTASGKYDTESIDKAVLFGEGSIGRCVDYLENPLFSQAVEIAGEAADSIALGDEYSALKALFSAESNKEMLKQIFLLLEEAFRDSAVMAEGVRSTIGCLREQSERIAEKCSIRECEGFYQAAKEGLTKLKANANKGLTINAFITEIFTGR
ncbi:MAG: ATP-binding protein [Oscillospiraceae bacterium]